VIGRAEQLVAGGEQANDDLRERGPVWEPESEVVQTGAVRRRRTRLIVPGVQGDVVVVFARREKRRLVIALGNVQAEGIAVEAERALEIGDGEVDVSDVCSRLISRSVGRTAVRLGRSSPL
jgi:hypothetical protein